MNPKKFGKLDIGRVLAQQTQGAERAAAWWCWAGEDGKVIGSADRLRMEATATATGTVELTPNRLELQNDSSPGLCCWTGRA